ncbi:MAG TPA: ATP-grasp ribosomal peptide maturase [Mycobacteriales bacterium]|nr:ATP-grasp ribosomal peptide maturase [Mycobacteriales bacterium]
MGGEPTVLILTQPFDVSADYVVAELQSRAAPVFRCDPGDFPRSLVLAAELGDTWTGGLRLPGRSLRLGDIGCAWYRRPTRFEFAEALSPEERRWATHEARLGVGGVLAGLPRWLNHPSDIARAEFKPVQLRAARATGLSVPPTLITNDPEAARVFVSKHDTAVYKPLSGRGVAENGHYKLIFANRLKADEVTVSVAATAHLFQKWVDKDHEIRLTVVDRTLFAVRIDAGSAAGRIDWRTDYASLRYSVVDVPCDIHDRVLRLLDMLMLRFAALDFVVTPDGEWMFLELNPNGQWAWLQDATGLPIAAAIADALTRGAA